MDFKEITKETFILNKDNKLSISFSDSPTIYYNVCLTNFCFSIGYSSDLMTLKALFVNKNSLLVGIDLKVAVVDITNEKIVKEIKLHSYFYDFKETEKFIVIICELEIIILDRISLKKIERKNFEDLIDDFKISNDQITVYLTNGKQETITFVKL